MTTARQLHDKYHPASPEEALEIAGAYIEELGDLPQAVYYQLGVVQADMATTQLVWKELAALRESYFEASGQNMPAWTDEYI